MNVRLRVALLSHLPFLLVFFLLLQGLTGCHERVTNPNLEVSLDDYDSLSSKVLSLSPHKFRRALNEMLAADSDSTLSDFYTRKYYSNHNNLVWVDRKGIDRRADSLVIVLRQVSRIGFNPSKFRLQQIELDLRRARLLDFGTNDNDINHVYARLEYNLTKAYFRYAAGQQFGFVNPNRLYNRLDVHDSKDKGGGQVSYRTLFALSCPTPNSSFYHRALHNVHVDSVSEFLKQVEPRSSYYKRLLSLLQSDSVSYFGKRLVLVNLERCRWRLNHYPWDENKAVVVNIPSFRLMAVNGSKTFSMRIGCGSLKTKTPLLCSQITRMDINPQWIMPRSIVKKSIIPHLGNRSYFLRHHYFIRERATGKIVAPRYDLRYGLEDGTFLAIQEGGEGNALGRIIFRFLNGLSIYLHDTSSKEVFSRDDRDVSHGCIRVEKPFDLAVFLLGNNHDALVKKIWYSMHADVSPLGKEKSELTDKEKAVADTLQRKLLVGAVPVNPAVPVYILYFTIYPNENGVLRSYSDVYGYDSLIYHQLENYI